MPPSLSSHNLIINPSLRLDAPLMGAAFTNEGVEVPEPLGLLAQSIGVRNAEHLLTALQEFPNAFEAILNLPRAEYQKARAALIERLERLMAERRRIHSTLSLKKSA